MTSSNFSVSNPIFNGENYDYWSVRMKTCLESHDLWDIIEEGFTIPGGDISNLPTREASEIKQKKQQNARALYLLQQSVGDTIFPRIMNAAAAKQAWDTLKEEFQGNSKILTIKLQSLRRDLENMKMQDNEAAKDYFSRIMDITNQMRTYGENVSNQRIIEKILISLTEKYDPIVAAIEQSKDLSTMSVTELMGSLEAHEQRISRRQESSLESAFQSKVKLRSTMPRDRSSSNGNYPPCGTCKRSNHLEKDCYFREKPQCQYCKRFGHLERDCRYKNEESQEKEKQEYMFYACHAATVEKEENDEKKSPEEEALFFQNEENKIKKFPKEIRKSPEEETLLWHQRFGHFHIGGLKHLHQKKMMKGLPAIYADTELCKECQRGKNHWNYSNFNKSWQAKNPLELVHISINGPIKTPSVYGHKYFMLFIDDFTRMTWIHFMHKRTEVSTTFQKFKSNVENKSGHLLQVIRSDNGKEYNSNEFEKFCKEATTVKDRNTPINGVCEGKFKTIMEMSRVMLEGKQMPQRFWTEAVYTTIYLLNRCPTTAIKGKTPVEAWSGRKPSARHLRVFGSLCYITKENGQEPEENSQKGIFMGYSSPDKGYRIFNLNTKRVVITKDVKFDEATTWSWDNEKPKKEIPTPKLKVQATKLSGKEEKTAVSRMKEKKTSLLQRPCEFATKMLEQQSMKTKWKLYKKLPETEKFKNLPGSNSLTKNASRRSIEECGAFF